MTGADGGQGAEVVAAADDDAAARVLTIGATEIAYRVRYSERAKRKRLVVTPQGVTAVVPLGTPIDGAGGVVAFMNTKRRWLFDAVRELRDKHAKLLQQRYGSGAKLQYRGRWLMLDVRSADVERVQIACRSKFHVSAPAALEGVERLEAIRAAFDAWLRERALGDVGRLARRHAKRLGVSVPAVRLTDSKARWGSCGKDGTVRVHWRLVQAPLAAFEYVVAHEVAHGLERHHGEAFWAVLGSTLPEWREGKALLERWEVEHRAV